ncbi:MAG: hypothetical protein IH612_18590 [Desulfofustis sp.]|nr:hypothetical protein [Desulfofustis sp.]
MEYAVNIIKSLGWPHVSLIFAILFVLLFKKQIQDFITKIKKVGRDGVSTEPTPEVQAENRKDRSIQQLFELGDSPFILEAETVFRKDFESKNLDMAGDTARILLRFLTVTQIALDFEQIHGVIFGSQIFLLKKLNEVSGQGLSQEVLDNHFRHVKELFSVEFADWDLSKYLNFLFSRNLITQNRGNYHITIKGVEFLVWMARTGHTDNRPL